MPSLSERCFNTHAKVALCFLILICSSSWQLVYGQAADKDKKGLQQIGSDAALTTWENKQKYFIVVAASKSASSKTDLPFAKVDGVKVSETLRKLGYMEIVTLPDKRATLNNFVANLKKVRELPDNSLVVVYYSGHGVVDDQGKDIWLQLYGQDALGDGFGLSLNNLIGDARGKSYKGELAVIIDACYSGQGALASALTLKDLKDTTIFTSSSEIQESYSINVDKIEMSAFTHFLLAGFTDDWDTADDNHDGIIQYEELRLYIKNKLTNLYRQGIIDGEMTPYIVSQQAEMIAAYDPSKVKNPKTQLREALSLSLAIKNNPVLILQGNKTASSPVPSPRAREIAKLIPNNADPYSLALKAIAEGRNDEARRFLEEAEKGKHTDLSEIYQARGEAEIYDGNFLEGIKWLEKAMQISPTENVELIEETAAAMFMVSNLEKAEDLANQARAIRQKASGDSKDSFQGIFLLAMINFMKGNFDKAELYFQQFQKIDPKALDEEEENLSLVPPLMLALLDIIQNKLSEAETKLRSILVISEDKLKSDDPVRVMCLTFLAGVYINQGKTAEAVALLKQFIALWEKAINEEDIDKVSIYITFAMGFAAGSSSPLSNDAAFESVCQQSKTLFEKEMKSDNPAVASSLTNLALIYKAQKKYDQAESFLKAALKSLEKTVGANNYLSVTTLNALGDLYSTTGRYTEAEQVFNRSLTASEKTFGQQSIFVLISIEALANVYVAQERYQEAEAARRRAAEISQNIWGIDNPMFASSLEELAEIHSVQKKYFEAERLMKQALAIKEKSYGPNHDEVGDSLMKLAQLYREQNRVADAEQFYRKALTIFELNGGHSDNIAGVLYNLGQLSEKQGKETEAETYFKRAIETDEKILGYEDPEVATDLRALAAFYQRKGNLKGAISLYSRSLSIREKAYGQEHPDVAVSLTSLGAIYCEQKDYDKAEPLLMRAIRIWEETPRPKAEEFATSLWWAARLNKEQGDFATAASLFQRLLALDESAAQPDLLHITNDLETLGMFYFVQGESKKAETAFLRSLNIREHAIGIPPVQIIYSFVGLALIYREQGKNEEAESFRNRGLEIILKTSQAEQTDLLTYLENYILLLRKMNRSAKAMQLETFVKDIREQLKKTAR